MPAGSVRRAAVTGVLAGLLAVVGGCAPAPATAPATPAPATPVPAPSAAPVPTAPASAVGDDSGGRSGGEAGDDSGGHGSGRGGSSGGGRGRGRDDGAPAGVALPADFPSDVPLPPGTLQASSGAAGQWSALLLVPGSAADALTSAMQFYVAHGFTADSPSTAHRDRYAITLVTENRDHSPTSTQLVVGVAAR